MTRLAQAQDAAAYFDVLPLHGKEPVTNRNDPAYVRHGFKDATRDPGKIRGWFDDRDDLNVGIRIPDLAVVLDPDTTGGKTFVVNDIFDGVLPDTPIAETGRGFLHIILRWPDGEPMPTRMTRKEGGQLWDGVDLLVNGYLAAAGSIHPDTGKPYRWLKHPRDYPIMLAPDHVVAAVRERMQKKRATPTSIPAEGEVIYEHEGRNPAVHAFMRSNRARGFAAPENEAAARAFNQRVCRPPLSPTEMRKIIRSATTQPDTAEFVERRQRAQEERAQVVDLFPPTPDPIAGGSHGSEPTAPRMPEGAMVGIGWEYAAIMDELFEAPMSFFYGSFVTMLGAALGGVVVLDKGNDPAPRLYTGLVAPTGQAKSEAIKQTIRFFDRYVGAAVTPYMALNPASDRGIAEVIEGIKRKPQSVLAVYDELNVFAQKGRIDNSALTEFFTQTYEDTRYGSSVRGKSIDLTDIHVSLIGATVPDMWVRAFSGEAVKQGLVNRFTIISDASDKSIPDVPNMPTAALQTLGDRIKAIVIPLMQERIKRGTLGPIRLGEHPDASALYREWYEDIRTRLGGHGQEPNVRLRGMAHRVALVNAIMRGERVVSVASMEAALAFVRYQREVRLVLAPSEVKGFGGEMEDAIDRWFDRHASKGEVVLERDVYCGVNPKRYGGPGTWDSTLNALHNAGQYDRDKKARPATLRRLRSTLKAA